MAIEKTLGTAVDASSTAARPVLSSNTDSPATLNLPIARTCSNQQEETMTVRTFSLAALATVAAAAIMTAAVSYAERQQKHPDEV